MLQIENSSPFVAGMSVLPDENGIDALYVAVKATYGFGRPPRPAPEQVPLTAADEYTGEPGESSLRYASEYHLAKPASDVVLVANAQAPDRRTSRELTVRLEIGNRVAEVRVFGDRTWKSGRFRASMTDPEPFEAMPLVYERAFGGVYAPEEGGEKVEYEPRNPVGTGFAGKRPRRDVDGLRLPNREDPEGLLEKVDQVPDPVGFGFIAPNWDPRLGFAGTYGESWLTERAPFLPDDFDPRFFNAAHPRLVRDGYLEGGEPVRIRNAWVHGPLEFRVPEVRFAVEVTIAGERSSPPLNLETLLIEPERDRFCMTWRAKVPCDKKALKVERVLLEAEIPDPVV